jgi:hypothetical protein
LVVPVCLFGAGVAVIAFLELRLRRYGYVTSRRAPRRRVHRVFDPARSVTMRGGVRVGWLNTTRPRARLTIDREWACIELRYDPADIWIGRDQVTEVTVFWVPFGCGVFFATEGGEFDGVIFWAGNGDTVSRTLAGLGWPVIHRTRH